MKVYVFYMYDNGDFYTKEYSLEDFEENRDRYLYEAIGYSIE